MPLIYKLGRKPKSNYGESNLWFQTITFTCQNFILLSSKLFDTLANTPLENA